MNTPSVMEAKVINAQLENFMTMDAAVKVPEPGSCQSMKSCEACTSATPSDGTKCVWQPPASLQDVPWSGWNGCRVATEKTMSLSDAACPPKPTTPFVFVPCMFGSLTNGTWDLKHVKGAPQKCVEMRTENTNMIFLNLVMFAMALLSTTDPKERNAMLLAKFLVAFLNRFAHADVSADQILPAATKLFDVADSMAKSLSKDEMTECLLWTWQITYAEQTQEPVDNDGVTSSIRDVGVYGLLPSIGLDALWESGYVPEETLFAAPYDWRKSSLSYNPVYFKSLKAIIEKAVSMNANEPAVVGCFSQGCPMTVDFMTTVDDAWKAKYVKSLYLGSPANGGSPFMLGSMACGIMLEDFPFTPWMAPWFWSPFGPYMYPDPNFYGEGFKVVQKDGQWYSTQNNSEVMGWFGLKDAFLKQIQPAIPSTTVDPGVLVFTVHGVGVPTAQNWTVSDCESTGMCSTCKIGMPSKDDCSEAMWNEGGKAAMIEYNCGDGTIGPRPGYFGADNWAKVKDYPLYGMSHSACYKTKAAMEVLITDALQVPCPLNPYKPCQPE